MPPGNVSTVGRQRQRAYVCTSTRVQPPPCGEVALTPCMRGRSHQHHVHNNNNNNNGSWRFPMYSTRKHHQTRHKKQQQRQSNTHPNKKNRFPPTCKTRMSTKTTQQNFPSTMPRASRSSPSKIRCHVESRPRHTTPSIGSERYHTETVE